MLILMYYVMKLCNLHGEIIYATLKFHNTFLEANVLVCRVTFGVRYTHVWARTSRLKYSFAAKAIGRR